MTEQVEEPVVNDTFKLIVKLVDDCGQLELLVSPQTSIQEIAQVLYDSPKAQYHTCFTLTFNDQTLFPFMTLGEIQGFSVEDCLIMKHGI